MNFLWDRNITSVPCTHHWFHLRFRLLTINRIQSILVPGGPREFYDTKMKFLAFELTGDVCCATIPFSSAALRGGQLLYLVLLVTWLRGACGSCARSGSSIINGKCSTTWASPVVSDYGWTSLHWRTPTSASWFCCQCFLCQLLWWFGAATASESASGGISNFSVKCQGTIHCAVDKKKSLCAEAIGPQYHDTRNCILFVNYIPLDKSSIKCRWLCFTKCLGRGAFHKHLVLHPL